MRARPDPRDELLGGRATGYRLRALGGAGAIAVLLVASHALSLDVRARELLELARGAGASGVLVYVGVYVIAALLGLPLSPVTAAAGAAYGPLAGAALAVPAASLGACSAFLVGRLIARDPDALACGEGRVARAARAIGRGGLRLVLLLRLVPVVPFSVLNFAFGMTPTRLSHFALGSVFGTIPSQLGYACLGAVLAWPPGRSRIVAEVALVAGAALLSFAAAAGIVPLLRGRRGPSDRA